MKNRVQFQKGKDTIFQNAFAISRKQASSSWEVLISYALDKSLLPRTLRFVLGELGIEFPMCLATDLRVCRSPISLPLIGIIESAFPLISKLLERKKEIHT